MKTMETNSYYTVLSINKIKVPKWQPHGKKKHGLDLRDDEQS